MRLRPSTIQRLACLPAILMLTACGAEFRSVRDLDRHALDTRDHGVASSVAAVPAAAEVLHGHRDFPATFERVWDATVQAVHAAGIGVPLSARDAQGEGRIDLDELLIEVEQPKPGRVCVFVRFRGVSRSTGEERARALLGEIARRLRIQDSSASR